MIIIIVLKKKKKKNFIKLLILKNISNTMNFQPTTINNIEINSF